MSLSTWSNIASRTFGTLCILSSLPFLGIPFPTKSSATYYADKNRWLSQLSNGYLTPQQAGFAGAALRIAVGLGCVFPRTRVPALLLNGAVVGRGTVMAHRDGRPMGPQWGMLSAIAVCLALEIL